MKCAPKAGFVPLASVLPECPVPFHQPAGSRNEARETDPLSPPEAHEAKTHVIKIIFVKIRRLKFLCKSF